MRADYACPSCDGRLRDAGAANAWRCRRCGQQVVEAISATHQRVRRFFDRATGEHWGGMSS